MPAMNNLVARNIDPARKATALGGCYTGFHTGAVRCRCIEFMHWVQVGALLLLLHHTPASVRAYMHSCTGMLASLCFAVDRASCCPERLHCMCQHGIPVACVAPPRHPLCIKFA